MRGFKIFYINGTFDLINSDQGLEVGTIDFQEHDVLVGMTYILDEKYSKRILKLGFTVIRDGQIYQYAPIGNDIKKLEVWPEL